jgi:hypothetical protein
MMTGTRVVVTILFAVAIVGALAVIAFRSERDEAGTSGTAPPTGAGAAAEAALRQDAGSRSSGAPPSVAASVEEPAGVVEWDYRYRTENLFSFAHSAAVAAMNGDARAAWLLSLVLTDCKTVLLWADRGDPALRGSLAEQRVDDLKLRRCEGFREAHPLDGLELPDEARFPRFWRELAIAGGDGRAVASRAVVGASALTDDMDAATKASQLALVMDDLHVAVASKDAEAIAAIANVFLQPNVSRDPSQGEAWLLAACGLGYDCSQTNPSLRHACVESRTCDGSTLADEIRRSANAADFAAAYAAAQDIAYNVRQGSWEGLQPYLVMKP